MGAHEHLAEAQFHRREGRPNKSEHQADGGDEQSNAPRKVHVRVHKQPKPKHRK
jgi:hypothetical protein